MALVWVLVLVVLSQDIASEISIKIPPNGMDVISLILDIVVFDQEGGALNPVIVFVAWLSGSGPSEYDIVQASFGKLFPSIIGYIGRHV